MGKSTSAAITALWWFTTHKRVRVTMTSASYRQVKSILWKELKRLYRESLQELPTKPANQPETGMQHEDGREIVGFSINEGNRAGGARIVMFSNPTKTVGAFYERSIRNVNSGVPSTSTRKNRRTSLRVG